MKIYADACNFDTLFAFFRYAHLVMRIRIDKYLLLFLNHDPFVAYTNTQKSNMEPPKNGALEDVWNLSKQVPTFTFPGSQLHLFTKTLQDLTWNQFQC